MKHWYAVLAAVALTGCTSAIVETEPLPAPGSTVEIVKGSYQLPRGLVPVTIKRAKCALSVVIGAPSVHPAGPKYRIAYNHDILYDDTVSVETKGGLLAGINSISVNQTPAVIAGGIGLAGEVAKLLESTITAPSLIKSETPSGGALVQVCPDVEITRFADPFLLENPTGTVMIVDPVLASANIDVSLSESQNPIAHEFVDRSPPILAPDCLDLQGHMELSRSGVCYRPVTEKWIEAVAVDRVQFVEKACLESKAEDAAKECAVKLEEKRTVVSEQIVSLPDINRLYYIPLDRKHLTKFDVKLTFDRGMLTKFESTDPSEALAALSVPSTIVRAILGLKR